MADGGQDDVGGIALAALEMAAAEMSVGLHVTDHGLDGCAAPELAFDHPEDPTLMAGDEGASCVGRQIEISPTQVKWNARRLYHMGLSECVALTISCGKGTKKQAKRLSRRPTSQSNADLFCPSALLKSVTPASLLQLHEPDYSGIDDHRLRDERDVFRSYLILW